VSEIQELANADLVTAVQSFVTCFGLGKGVQRLQKGVYSVRLKGPCGRETTGIQAVVLKTALVLITGLVCCAAASAAEPARLQVGSLPEVRMQTLRLAPGPGRVEANGFRPAGLQFDRPKRASVRFYDTHLMPELREQFRGMGDVYQNLPGAGAELEQFTLHAAVTDSARRTLERATTRALKEFVLEWTQIERRLLSIPLSRKVSSAVSDMGGSSKPRRRSYSDLGFSVGVSSLRPQVGLRYRLGETTTEFEIDGHGSVDVGFSRSSVVYTRIAVQYDAQDDWYGLYYRARF